MQYEEIATMKDRKKEDSTFFLYKPNLRIREVKEAILRTMHVDPKI